MHVVDGDTIVNLPEGENLLLDLTDRSVVYEVDVSSELDIGRVFAISVVPLEELLEGTVVTRVDQTAR